MKRQRGLFTAMLLLITALACVVPGFPSASQPVPTPDTRLGTMVAETVSAALELTRQAVPTSTLPPTPTPEPTITSTPQVDSAGSALTKNDDGSVTFIDLKGNYQIIISSDWLAVRINEQEFLDAWLLPIATDPAFQRALGNAQNQDAARFRLFAFDASEEHIDGGFVTNINFLWDDQEEISLEDSDGLTQVADTLPDSLPGIEVLSIQINTLEDATPIGVITSRLPATTLDGVEVVIAQKQIFFDLPVGTLFVTLSTTETWQETIEPSFDAMIETFTFVKTGE